MLPARMPLMRPKRGRWLTGVCKGIALHLGISVVWVRMVFLALTLLYGAGIIGYVFLWIFMPAGDPVAAASAAARTAPVAQAPLARGNQPISPIGFGGFGTYGVSAGGFGTGASHVPGYGDGGRAGREDGRGADGFGTTGHASGVYGTAAFGPAVHAINPTSTPGPGGAALPVDPMLDAADTSAPESLTDAVKRAPKPALVALSGIALMGIGLLLASTGVDNTVILPLLMMLAGIALAWMNPSPQGTQLLSMLGGIALIFVGWTVYVGNVTYTGWGTSPRRIMASGFVMVAAMVVAVMPWAGALLQRLSHEQALKEREEERADMTAHLHDGVLQTLALIQLHDKEPDTVFTLARAQERELREWLYQERSTSDRSVGTGLKQIAAQVEDEHGKPIEVVIVGDARPSAQTDALLDATRQALVNAVTHGGEPIALYCEATPSLVEVFVRDHGHGFDVDAIPPDRLGIRESIIGRIRRRGGSVEIVSRTGWGTEVRMHMPIAMQGGAAGGTGNGSAGGFRNGTGGDPGQMRTPPQSRAPRQQPANTDVNPVRMA